MSSALGHCSQVQPCGVSSVNRSLEPQRVLMPVILRVLLEELLSVCKNTLGSNRKMGAAAA